MFEKQRGLTGPSSPDRRRGGFTLLEVAISLAIVSVIVLVVGNLLESSNQAVAEMTTGVNDEQAIRRTLSRLYDDVKQSAVSRVSITEQTTSDILTLQTPDPSGSGNWGAQGSDGVFRANHFARYHVVNGSLVRTILDGGGNELSVPARQVLLFNADSGAVGTKGLAVSLTGSVLVVQLASRKALDPHVTVTSTKRTSIFIPTS